MKTDVRIFSLIFLLMLILIALSVQAQSEKSANLPYRTELAKEITFWKMIFAKISRDQYLIHDSRELGIIYKKVTFDSTVTGKARSKELKALKKQVSDLLLSFAKSDFSDSTLTPWEKHVYNLFENKKDKNQFKKAAEHVRAQQGIKENFMAGVRRSFAYLPHIKRIFREVGVPQELIYLPHMESSFNPSARSHVGAGGMWQFMRSTARSYMKVNRIADQRYDPLIATRSAARLLKYNYSQLKSWPLAITAYNHGLGSMRKAKRKYGNYIQAREKYLRRSFGFASKNFYPEFLAVIDIMDSLDYYFPNVEKDELLVFQELVLPKPVNLKQFAKKFKLDIAELKSLNPSYKRQIWSGARSVPAKYLVRLPVATDAQQIMASLSGPENATQNVTLAQKAYGKNELVLTNLSSFFNRRKHLRAVLKNARPGVKEEVISPAFDDVRFAFNDYSTNSEVSQQATLAEVHLETNPSRAEQVNWQKPGVLVTAPEKDLGRFNPVSLEVPIAEASPKKIEKPAEKETLTLAEDRQYDRLSLTKPGVSASAPEKNLRQFDAFDINALAAANASTVPEAVKNEAAILSLTDRQAPRLNLDKPNVENVQAKINRPIEIGIAKNDLATSAETKDLTLVENNLAQALVLDKPGVALADRPFHLRFTEWLANVTLPDTASITKPEAEKPAYTNFSGKDVPSLYEVLQTWQVIYENREMSSQELFALLKSRLAPSGKKIVVYPGETLGHFSDWLNLNTQDVRRINHLPIGQTIKTGQTLTIKFSGETEIGFLEKRLAYHISLIQKMLKGHSRIYLEDYAIQSGENLWQIAHKRYKFPVNLLLYFNDLDKLERLYPGDVIKVPIIN